MEEVNDIKKYLKPAVKRNSAAFQRGEGSPSSKHGEGQEEWLPEEQSFPLEINSTQIHKPLLLST